MKNPFQNILVPTDFSAGSLKALELAAMQAKLSGAKLSLVHVYDPVFSVYDPPDVNLIPAMHKELEKLAVKKLKDHAAGISKKYGITAGTSIHFGKIAHEIISAAEESRTDLIVMGTHGAKGLEELFIGSNAGKVVTMARCPVLTIRENFNSRGLQNIILPIDRSLHSREKVHLAVQIALLNKGIIHLLGLAEDEDKEELGKLHVIMDQVEHFIREAKLPMTRKLVHSGNLAERAMNFAEDVSGDLIIIMTDQESRLTGMFLGPTAKQIVNHAVTPVLSVKPHYRSFQSMGLDGDSLIY